MLHSIQAIDKRLDIPTWLAYNVAKFTSCSFFSILATPFSTIDLPLVAE